MLTLTRRQYADVVRGYVCSRLPHAPQGEWFDLGHRLMAERKFSQLDPSLAAAGYLPPPRPHPVIMPPAPDRPLTEHRDWFEAREKWFALDRQMQGAAA